MPPSPMRAVTSSCPRRVPGLKDMVVWMQADYIGLAVCGDPASQKHLPGPDRLFESKVFHAKVVSVRAELWDAHRRSESPGVRALQRLAIGAGPDPFREAPPSSTRERNALGLITSEENSASRPSAVWGSSRNGWIVLGTVAGTVTQQSGAPAPGRACKLLQRMEAPPGFEPGMEVLQKSDRLSPAASK
jgi:hypothetical protein